MYESKWHGSQSQAFSELACLLNGRLVVFQIADPKLKTSAFNEFEGVHAWKALPQFVFVLREQLSQTVHPLQRAGPSLNGKLVQELAFVDLAFRCRFFILQNTANARQ